MNEKIQELASKYDWALTFEESDGVITVFDTSNDVEEALIEMSEAEWLELLPVIESVLDWWVNESEPKHHWLFNNTSFNLPTIYKNTDSVNEFEFRDFFYGVLEAYHEIKEETLMLLPFLELDEEKAISWIRMGDYPNSNIDDIEDFSDTFYTYEIDQEYTWDDLAQEDDDSEDWDDELGE